MSDVPLAETDPPRAAAVRRKVLERLTDVARHYRALEAAVEEFGEQFGREEFAAASASEDPVELNRVKAVERGLDQLSNYVAELGALGLQLAGVRAPQDDSNARADFRRLRDIGVIEDQVCERLTRVASIRNRMVHDYVRVSALDVHEAVRLLHGALPGFVAGYQEWLRAGFPAPR